MEFEATPDDIRNIREWLEKIPYLPHDLDDHFLRSFYRGCKGSLEKTKKCLDDYYHAHSQFPEMMANYNPLSKETQLEFDISAKVPLPKKTKDGWLIISSALTNTDPDLFDPIEMFKGFTLTFKILAMENDLGSCEVAFILSTKGMNARHVSKITPMMISRAVQVLSVSPLRVKAIHGLYMPAGCEWLFNFCKSLISTKLGLRIHIHQNPKELLEFYPKEILPSDFGGELESLKTLHGKFRKRIESYTHALLEEEEKLLVLDKLRPKSDEILVGSFKKLDID